MIPALSKTVVPLLWKVGDRCAINGEVPGRIVRIEGAVAEVELEGVSVGRCPVFGTSLKMIVGMPLRELEMVPLPKPRPREWPKHPDDPHQARGLRAVGYWRRRKGDTDLPDPAELVDPDWDLTDRFRVARHLESQLVLVRWRGWSRCRLCGEANGSTCLSDGAYVWPEGLAHYVERHAVTLPSEFLDHVRKHQGT